MITKYQKEHIIKLLEDGEEIPEDFKYLLFPTKHKEYELAYSGKMRKEDILANEDGVFPVPLQVEKVFNGSEYKSFDDDWKNMIVFGDNLQFLKTINENKDPLVKDKVKGKVKLIYIDPPFATEEDFSNKEGSKAYTDKKKGAEFIEFLRKRLVLAKEVLADDGSIIVHLDWKKAHHIKLIMDEIFGELNFINDIIWYYRRWNIASRLFSRNHDILLYYSKTKGRHTFNNLFIPKSKKSSGQGKAWVSVIDEATGKRTSYLSEEKSKGVPMPDVWDISMINPVALERKQVNYPTQKPEALLKRIIDATTNKGDIVLDFFGGSGSTMSVAEKLGRKWITCDLGKLSFFTMQKRILQIQNSKSLTNSKKLYENKAKSFITASLGSYDLQKTFELERDKYLNFVSGLFEINHSKFKISGFEFDGKKGNHPVIIFDYKKYENSSINESYLNNIHKNIGKKLSGRVYIVAPINFVDFVDDYIEIDNIKYFFLKIPYHIIHELHKTPFVKVRQPQSKKNVNDIEESIGFHFKRTPEVEAELVTNDKEVTILIKNFKSNELESDKTINEKNKRDFENLSAVFIDKTYNGKSFEMDTSLFVDELLPKKKKGQSEDDFIAELKKLSECGVEIKLKKSNIGEQIMIVFTDIYGNDVTKTFKI